MTLPPKYQVEALLFSSGKAMSEEQLALLTKRDKSTVRRALKALQKEYEKKESAVALTQDGHEWKMGVTNEYIPLVKNIVADTELSRACLETLAVIAYRYPKALQSDVIDVRGSSAYEHIAELDKLGFVIKQPKGRSFTLKLAEKFFEYFDVAGEKDIKNVFKHIKPPEKQKKLGDMDVVPVEEKKKELGLEVVPVAAQPEKPNSPEEEEDEESHAEFLDDLDKRIASISSRNDEREADEQLQRQDDETESETVEQEEKN